MPTAAALAASLMSARPTGALNSQLPLGIKGHPAIANAIRSDAEDAAYAAALSFSEAVRGLRASNTSWATVKLYYAAYYSLKAAMLMDDVVSFFSGSYYLVDIQSDKISKGGRSSHIIEWRSLHQIRRLSSWYYSSDSEEAYDKLRSFRETANYKSGFMDPKHHQYLDFLLSANIDRTFREYRDDSLFVYTYLDSHLILSYPTKLLFSVSQELTNRGWNISAERSKHLQQIWPFKDKTPIK
ncbi:MAG: hypothetical protein KF723_01255 [Rhizobiaceae bacterium]|nr:hypothetical protein [Rhizobiaceae bacterium]